jgi:hypothetical protein
MKKDLFVFMFLLTLSIHLNAWCFSTDEVIIAKQNGKEGIEKVYPVNKDQAWKIALAVLRWERSNDIDEHYMENYMLTSIGPRLCPCKTAVGVWIEPMSDDRCKVTIITKGREQKNLFTNVETFPDVIKPKFHKWFGEGIKIVKNGDVLPEKPPK